MSLPSSSRRSFLIGTGVVAVPVVLAGCGFTQQSSPEGRQGTLTFTTWGTDAELAGFRAAIAAFEAANEGSTVELNAVPYEQMFTNIDAQLQAGNPPDVFRVPYYTFGAYAGREQLLDLGPLLSADRQDQFTPQAWSAVQSAGSTYGLPHHTDTSAILVNRDLFAAAGITEIPDAIEDAWTWEELAEIGDRLKAVRRLVLLPGLRPRQQHDRVGQLCGRVLVLPVGGDGVVGRVPDPRRRVDRRLRLDRHVRAPQRARRR